MIDYFIKACISYFKLSQYIYIFHFKFFDKIKCLKIQYHCLKLLCNKFTTLLNLLHNNFKKVVKKLQNYCINVFQIYYMYIN